jgi:hypothetical protein
MTMNYVLPTLFSIPAFISWAALFYRLFSGRSIPCPACGWALVSISFLAFTASVAMSFVKPRSKEWRAAAIFNAIPFVLVLVWVSLLQLIMSD